jgi:ABC-2 type transport system permease protein
MVRERAAWALMAAFAAMLLYAALGAGLLVRSDRRALDETLREEAARIGSLRAEVVAIAGGAPVRHVADPRSPHLVGRELGRRAATLPPGPLAPVSVGQRDLLPHTVQVTSHALLAEADEGDGASPARRAAGPFDPAFVFVFLLPLVIIGLAYDICAGERERGTLGLVLSQPLSLSTFVLGKALQRGLLSVSVVLLLGLAAPVLVGGTLAGEGAAMRVFLYAALLIAYTVFWFTAAVAVNAWGRSSSGNALTLVGLWLAVVVVVPGLTSVAVDVLHPMPSRVELVNLARSAASEAEAQVSAIEGDHGAAVGAGDRSERRAVEVQRDLERRVQPVLDAFRDQLGRQQRLVDRLRFLSPAILLHEGLNDVAGSGVGRHQHFSAQVDGFHAAYKEFVFDRIQRGVQLTPADYDVLPRFEYREEPSAVLAARVGVGLLGLLGPAAALVALALAGLRRGSVLAP